MGFLANKELLLRLLISAVLGSMIGLERELRAKEAGLRTHFLVTLGSALFMIISQYGFQASVGTAGLRGADQARVAAQIVSGIGFLGAGTIIMQKRVIRGLTTAAGLWVSAAIGMAVGGGLYLIAIAATILTLIGLELFGYLFRNIKPKNLSLVFSIANKEGISRIINALNSQNYKIKSYTVLHPKEALSEPLRVRMYIRTHANLDQSKLLVFMQQFPDALIEKIS